MGWKNWKPWVKGGIWVIGIYVFITLILLPFERPTPCTNYFCFDYDFLPTFYASIPLAYFFATILGWDSPLIFYYVYAILTLFVIGAIIGWIVRKRKGKKRVLSREKFAKA